MRAVLTFCLGIGWLFATLPAVSHHSFAAEFDVNRPIELTGAITRVELTNPHAWIYLDVEGDDGGVENWGIELLGVNTLYRRGWRRDTLQPGDLVSVTGFGSRDGRARGNASSVTRADTGELLWESAAP
ncbi:MAG TPA: DUF6152 family protein [Gammaproteobacteria bacterium]